MNLIGEWTVGEWDSVHITLEHDSLIRKDFLTLDIYIPWLFRNINKAGDLQKKYNAVAGALFEPDAAISEYLKPVGQMRGVIVICGTLKKHPTMPEGWEGIFSSTPLLNPPEAQ